MEGARDPIVVVGDDASAAAPGTERDFEREFERLAVLAYRVARRIVGPAGDAENIAAEAMARAQVRWGRVQGHPEAWVVTVAGRLAVREARRRQRVLPWFGTNVAPADGDSAPDRLVLVNALRRLSRSQRQVVVLRYLAGLTEQEVAQVLGCSVSTVRTHARRALEHLRAHLSDPPAWVAPGKQDDGS